MEQMFSLGSGGSVSIAALLSCWRWYKLNMLLSLGRGGSSPHDLSTQAPVVFFCADGWVCVSHCSHFTWFLVSTRMATFCLNVRTDSHRPDAEPVICLFAWEGGGRLCFPAGAIRGLLWQCYEQDYFRWWYTSLTVSRMCVDRATES